MTLSLRLVFAAQFFFGGWFLFHGLNYFFDFFPQSGVANPHGLIPTLIQTGLFAWIKVAEVLIGVLLLANLYVPLAIAAAVPITAVIAYHNLLTKADLKGVTVGIVIIALHAIMAAGYWDRYKPMLVRSAGAPMPVSRHVVAVLLGIAFPVALTFASLL